MSPMIRRQFSLALALLGAVGPLTRPGQCAPQDAPPVEAPEEIKRLEEWPEVDKDTVKLDVERLRAARTEEMGDQADVALRTAGAGVVPYLLPKLGKEKDEEARERMIFVLDSVTGAPHTRLLAKSFKDRSVVVRKWSLRRVALFHDPELRKQAEAAYEAAKKRKRDLDEDEVFVAALCCASTGSFKGFEDITARAAKDWGDEGGAIHTALTALRSAEGTAAVAPLLAEPKRASKVAGLRLIAACGEAETAKALVAPFLDDNDNSLRVAAINALRGIVDGDPPLDKLSVFEAIERANKWKSRL
jgi:hypothetical protein